MVLGNLADSLSNKGQTITLADAEGTLIESVSYTDRFPWPEVADKFGASLERLCVNASASSAGNWVGSTVPTGVDAHVDLGGTPARPAAWQVCPPFAAATSKSEVNVRISEIMYVASHRWPSRSIHIVIQVSSRERTDTSRRARICRVVCRVRR